MKYWSFAYPDSNDKDCVDTLSESDIIAEYWPFWYVAMCNKFGKEHVDANYSEQDCIDDWVVVHWAWESKDGIPITP